METKRASKSRKAAAPGSRRRISRETATPTLPNDFVDPIWKPDLVMIGLIEEQGWTYKFLRIPTTSVREHDGGVQVRFATNEQVVEDYADAMRGGKTQFDTPTVDSDVHGVDFIHRLAAAKAAGLSEIVVIQIQRRLSPSEANLLAIKRNKKHGLRQTHQEVREIAINLLAEGKSVDFVADEMDIPRSTVKTYASETAAKAEARDLGVETQFARLPASVAAAIPTNMHKPLKKEVIRLLADSKATASKAKDIIAHVEAAPTDPAARKVIQELRAKRVPQPGQSTPRVMSESEASSRIIQRSGLFREALRDTAVTTALLQSTPASPKYKLVKEMLEALRDGLDPLFAHYHV